MDMEMLQELLGDLDLDDSSDEVNELIEGLDEEDIKDLLNRDEEETSDEDDDDDMADEEMMDDLIEYLTSGDDQDSPGDDELESNYSLTDVLDVLSDGSEDDAQEVATWLSGLESVKRRSAKAKAAAARKRKRTAARGGLKRTDPKAYRLAKLRRKRNKAKIKQYSKRYRPVAAALKALLEKDD